MFEKYTEKARRVIFFARYEASQTGAQAIEAEHILLGVVRDDKVLTHALFEDAVSEIDTIRGEIAQRSGPGQKVHTSVDMPLSPSARRVLSYADQESTRLNHNQIGSEHLLLGLIREEGSLASELLIARGVTVDKIIAYAKRRKPETSEHLMPRWTNREQFSPETTHTPLSAQLESLVDRLAQKGIVSREQFNEQVVTHASFNLLLDLLVRKQVISEDEKRKISFGQS